MRTNKFKWDVDKILKIVIVLVIVVVAFILSRKVIKTIIDNARESKFDKNIDKKVNGKNVNLIAQSYRSALNPSGTSWLDWSDGTDEDAIFKLALETKGVLKEVSEGYKAKFGTALVDDLRDELSSEDFAKWQSIVM